MKRREFMSLIGGAAVLLSRDVGAQQPQKLRLVGFLAAGGRPPKDAVPPALRQALQSLGYNEGQNIAYEARYAEGKMETLPALATDLVQRNVEVIVANSGPAGVAAKRASASIPIVLANGAGDAVATGMVASLSRPGANVTGMSEEAVQLSAKRLEIIKETFPKATKIAVLWNVGDLGMTLRYREIEKAARALGVQVQPLEVRAPDDFDSAFAAMSRARPDAVFLVADPLTNLNRRKLVEYAAAHRIPAMYESGFIVRDGGLMSYGRRRKTAFASRRATWTASSKARSPPSFRCSSPRATT